MATFVISVDTNYSTLAGIADNDTIDVINVSTLTINQTTVDLGPIFCDNIARTIEIINTSTTTPIFFKTNGNSFSMQGTLEFSGDWISIGTSNGTASQTFTLPQDSLGESYADLGFLKVGNDLWSRVDALSDLYSDERGELFTHAVGSDLITFGDGTTGKIPPNGDEIFAPNIQWKATGSRLSLVNGTLIGDIVAFHTPDITNNGTYKFTQGVGHYNSEQRVVFYDLSPNEIDGLVVNGDSSHDTRMLLGAGTHQNILFVSQNDIATEAVDDQSQSYTIDSLKCLFLNPKTNNNARVRLNLNDSTINELRIYVGDGDFALRQYNGNGGVVESLVYGCTTRPSQTAGAYGIILGSGTSQDLTINSISRIGTETHTEMTRAFDIRTTEGLSINDFVSSADFLCTRFFDIELAASASLKDSVINGTITDGTSRTLDTSSNIFSSFLNVSFPDETFVGNQPSDNMLWENIQLIANTPVLGRYTRSVTTRDVVTNDSGYIGLQPYYQDDDDFVSIISGSSSAVLQTRGNFQLSDTLTEVQIESRVIGGVTAITSYSVAGSNPGNFTITYDMRTNDGVYSGVYQTLNLANLQASFAALTGYDSDEGLFIIYRVKRTAGDSSNRISTISIGCTFDAAFVYDDTPPMTVIFENLTIGDYIRLEDGGGVERFYFQAAATTETVVIEGRFAGETWKRSIDSAGYSPDVGTFLVVPDQQLPISVSLIQYERLDGQPMYTGSTSPFISIEFDFGPPQASIVVGDAEVDAQTIFDMVEDALLTSNGMKWHSDVGSVTQYDDIAASGKILSLRDYWRLRSDSVSSLNSAVAAYVTSTQGVVVDGVNGDVRFSPAGISSQMTDIHNRFDLNSDIQNTYRFDNTKITNSEFTLDSIDNGDGTFTVVKT